MKEKINNFFTSGWNFNENEIDVKSKVQMINISLLLSGLGLIYGISINIINNISGFVPIELLALFLNMNMLILLRKNRYTVNIIATFLTFQYTIFFLFLIYKSDVNSLRHIWIFTYPLILLYFQGTKKGIYWLGVINIFLLIAPFQPFVDVSYSLFQIIYMIFVLIIITIVMYFYQYKMDEIKNLLFDEQKKLKEFNHDLELKVNEKTNLLLELNESLENKVQDKLEELIKRDNILEAQSKQAVMGEMISMIAHQWRQPLSTITLQISQLQFKKMLGEETTDEDLDNTLTKISDTIVYLSDTIDDFLTYFQGDKDSNTIEVHELLQKAVNLSLPRAQKIGVEILIDKHEEIELTTYINELIQVIVNILNNAIDALEESSKETFHIKLTTEIQEHTVILSIIDNADGMSLDVQRRLFEPYFSTKGKNGTGLGMYMSQMIIEKQLNGTIDVNSSSNGTTFVITIPDFVE